MREPRAFRAGRDDDPSNDSWPFVQVLSELSASAVGINSIYTVLELLAKRFDLVDVVVVLADDNIGTQSFRLGRRGTCEPGTVVHGRTPGIYSSPDIVPPPIRDAVLGICALALAHQIARHGAAHDPLTNLANRRAFDASLQTAAAQSARYGWTFTVVFIDLNEFKSVNDLVGHVVGDELLRSFGTSLRRSIRSGDIAARVGGDEFAVILGNAESAEVASFVNRLRSRLVATPVRLEFTVGTATAPHDSTDAGELYRLADSRLYKARG
jgi:diguanylate cyclase (GGDEF)-like protein